MLEWERDRKKEKEEKIINQEDQISELTFNFHRALSTSAFLKWIHLVHQEKHKKNKEKKERRTEKKRRKKK